MFSSHGNSAGQPVMPSVVTHRLHGVADGISCMAYCHIAGECDSFSFNPQARSCLLHNTTLAKSVNPIHRKDYQYYDKVMIYY